MPHLSARDLSTSAGTVAAGEEPKYGKLSNKDSESMIMPSDVNNGEFEKEE